MTGGTERPRPARLDPTPRPARWVLVPAVVGGLLFTVGLLTEARCAVGRCPGGGWYRLFALDSVGALPRLFTTAVFLAVVVLAGLAVVRSAGRVRWWWTALVAAGVVLAAGKAGSVSTAAEQEGGRYAVLAGEVLLAVIGLSLLWWAGRRWSVRGSVPVTLGLAGYVVAALGLDQVSVAVRSVSDSLLALAFATYVEEGAEAVAALLLLALVSAWRPGRT